jgi:hypothetical protein
MVTLRLKKMEVQHIILWGERYRDISKEIGIPFEKDENDLLNKLNEYRKNLTKHNSRTIQSADNTDKDNDDCKVCGAKKGRCVDILFG